MLICEATFSAIDFESAGASVGATDAAVQIGLACWSLARGLHSPFVSYLNISQEIHWSAQKVHGITTRDLADAPTLVSLWPEVKSRLAGATVVAHGKGTEKRFLRALPGHGFSPWVDTLHLSRAAWPELAKHSLGAVCNEKFLTPVVKSHVPTKQWHDALFDSVASLVLLAHIIEVHNLSQAPIEILLRPDMSSWLRARSKAQT